ncbi:hypothetical protein AGABI1DRAFT_131592 [Agaricus bisporus var. burnettii JB137-S8]|uniref:Fungal calcium binding protein domain-containing protein n=1 Tax=Agaricus bisporus var. burnettii (strain JB137-S8 / ATCC MYA-4627 / FGSC 10392) TaxID=597362 RepID=K5WLC4_AGABU|nr:uncharacterized protein AGABI1DRAFT_131592 [Agaricus bisporus var. burnettii JB137-S8]EKM76071.1 hypothetical protein AGABI1DRAFT_131592 [Agaricus bisporus var. burnettii JB137-S8]
MKLTLAQIFPLFFAVSALGNPVATDNAIDELDPRQLNCDIAQCLQTIFTQTAGIIQPCGAALQSLEKVGEDILTGEFPPNQADLNSLASNTIKCVLQSVTAGFAIPGACLSCVI